jgi:hypothetical protein
VWLGDDVNRELPRSGIRSAQTFWRFFAIHRDKRTETPPAWNRTKR